MTISSDSSDPRSDRGAEKSATTRARSTEEYRPLSEDPAEVANQRPALEKLRRDQNNVCDELTAGFATLEGVFDWVVKANVRTLGTLSPAFFRELTWRQNMRWLLEPGLSAESVNRRAASSFREDTFLTVTRAADRAYREFRTHVSEYTDGETPKVHLEGDTVAFRPALTELESRQQAVLKGARNGFATRQDLVVWERDLMAATYGKYEKHPAYQLALSRNSWGFSVLTSDVGRYSWARDRYLLRDLFRACIDGVRAMRLDAEEDVSNGPTEAESLDG